MRKIVLTFGLIAGGIMSAMMALTMVLWSSINQDHGYLVGYSSMVLAFLMVYFGVRSYRDNVAGGEVSFFKAFQVGFLITLLATCCYVASWEVIYRNYMPNFGDEYAAAVVKKAKASGASEEEIARQTQQVTASMEQYKNNVLVRLAYTFAEPLPVGLVFALVTAGVLSRKRKEGDGTLAGAVAR